MEEKKGEKGKGWGEERRKGKDWGEEIGVVISAHIRFVRKYESVFVFEYMFYVCLCVYVCL